MATEPPPKRQKLPASLSSVTTRTPSFLYLNIELLLPETRRTESEGLDDITVRAHLTSALKQFLGLTGTAVPVDILKCEKYDVWIRVPHDNGHAVIQALSGWVGGDLAWRVKGSGSWLGGLGMGSGADLFR